MQEPGTASLFLMDLQFRSCAESWPAQIGASCSAGARHGRQSSYRKHAGVSDRVRAHTRVIMAIRAIGGAWLAGGQLDLGKITNMTGGSLYQRG
jgi:hypothetical protein